MAVDKKNDSKNKKIIGYIAYVLAFLLAFYVVKEIRNKNYLPNMSANLESNIKDKIEDAKQKTDGLVMEELKKEELVNFDKRLTNEKDENKKLNLAADNFFGYYLINAEGRKKYCEKFGVKIPKFVNAFKSYNQQLFDRASKIKDDEQKRSNKTLTLDQIFVIVEPSFNRLLDQDFSDMRKAYNLSEVEACELIEENASKLVKEMDYKKINVQATTLLLK
jgi:hypothetical protein